MNADHVAHNAVVSLLWGATGHATIARAATRGATGSNAWAMTLSSTWDAIESPVMASTQAVSYRERHAT